MAYEHKENSGSLFINEKRNERDPDFAGTCNVDGQIWRVAGWKNPGRNGGKARIGLKFSVPNAKGEYKKKDDDGFGDF